MEYGDRQGNWVYVKSPLGFSGNGNIGFWIDVTTGASCDNLKLYHDRLTHDFKAEKPRYVNFIRYLRPKRIEPFAYEFYVDYRHEIDNMRGTTFAISLDYEAGTISFGYSICNGDNFEKYLGKQLAIDRLTNRPYTISMARQGYDFSPRVDERGVLEDIFQSIVASVQCTERTRLLKEFYDSGF